MLREKRPRFIGKKFFIKGTLLILVFIVFSFLTTTAYSETLFRVSGKVLRKGKGVKGAVVNCTGDDKNSNHVYLSKITDSEGKYEFELKKGKYRLSVSCVNDKYMHGMCDLRYLKVMINDRNIRNLNFHLFTEEEIIKVNKDIFDAVPENKPHVEYKWGRIPLHSEEECFAFVKKRFKEDVDMIAEELKVRKSEVLNGMRFKKPVLLYDLRGNIVSYLYYVEKKGIEVGRYEVMAIGKKIVDTTRSALLLTKQGYEDYLRKGKTTDELKESIDRAIDSYAKNMGFNKKDLKIIKLISGILSERRGMLFSPFIMLKNIVTNRIDLVSLKYGEGFPEFWKYEDIKYWYEKQMTMGYLEQNGLYFVNKFKKLMGLYK